MRESLLRETIELPEDYWWLDGKHRLCLDLLRDIELPEPRLILDVGCGSGSWALRVAREMDGRAFGADISHISARKARENGLLSFVAAAESVSLQPESLSLVTALDVLEHIEDDGRALRNFHRLLRPEGLLLLHVPAHPWLFSAWDVMAEHKRRYSREEFARCIQSSGFEILRIQSGHFLPFFPAAARRLWMKWKFGDSVPRGSEEFSDYVGFPAAVDSCVKLFYRGEVLLRRFTDIPPGLSLIALARKI